MKRFKNILYIFDSESEHEEKVITKVITLARLNSAVVTVVRLLEDSLLEQISRNLFSHDKPLTDLARQQMQEEVDLFLVGDQWQGITVNGTVLQGKGFISVIKKVLKDGHDLVIKNNSIPHGVDPLAMRLMRKCPCPIWIFNGKQATDIKRVLAAVDASSEDDEAIMLNKKIIELAHSLAQREGGEAHYLHSWHLQSETMLRGPRFKISDDKIHEMKAELKVRSEKKLTNLLDSLHIEPLPGHTHTPEGKTDIVIKDAISQLNIDIIVLGTVGRTGVPGLLIGNTVETLLTEVACSVLAVKPDGFISPVTH